MLKYTQQHVISTSNEDMYLSAKSPVQRSRGGAQHFFVGLSRSNVVFLFLFEFLQHFLLLWVEAMCCSYFWPDVKKRSHWPPPAPIFLSLVQEKYQLWDGGIFKKYQHCDGGIFILKSSFWCCSSCEMVGNVKRLMEVTPRSIFSSCVILFCPRAQDPWRSLDRWRGKTSFLFSLRHCLRGGRTSKTICKNTISASDNQSTHQDFYTIWHKNLSSVYLSKAIHVSSLFSALQQNQPRTASQLSIDRQSSDRWLHMKKKQMTN